MNKTSYKILFGCLLAGWMIIIFYFSAQVGEESGALSGSIVRQILDIAERIFKMDLAEAERLHLAETLGLLIRKGAHMTEYAILALLSVPFWKSFAIEGKKAYLVSLLLAALYAITDEFHQTFVPGRAGTAIDVCIDVLGALIGLLLLGLVQILRRKHCEKKRRPYK